MDITLMNDSASFADINGFDIFNLQLDSLRTPIYPMIIEAFQRISPNGFYQLIVCFQFIVSAISVIYLYNALEKLSVNTYLIAVVVALYSVSSCVTAWEVYILCESLALSLTTILVYYLVEFYHTTSLKDATYLAALSFVLIYLRPTSILLSCLVLGYILLRCAQKKEGFFAILRKSIPLVIVLASVFMYMNVFQSQHGVKTLSLTLSNQQLVQVIDADIYTGVDASIECYIEEQLILQKESDAEITTLMIAMNTANEFGYDVISAFVTQAILQNPFAYLSNRVSETMNEVAVPFALVPNTASNFFLILVPIRVLAWIVSTPITFMMGFQAALISLIFVICNWIRKKELDLIHLGLFVIIAGTYASAIFGTCAAYARTALQSLPFIILSFTFFADYLIALIKRK